MTQEFESTPAVVHQVRRLQVDVVGVPYEDFRERYEAAVPALDEPRFEELKGSNADWDTVLTATAENSPHDFIIYWRNDVTAMMSLAGNEARCTQYLMGNHGMAERMYRYDAAVMLYAPLRTTLVGDPDGAVRFCVDQPSTQFSSFGDSRIARVGAELDEELARLLESLEVGVPAALAMTGDGEFPTSMG
ncbi:hypothetical protein OIE71_32715 [Streptomyces sp. NBC_01725]|uniref:hypothetical protein n=1 Tax=Streptomyces sp. NBC_01725 TaxID=2975923 RepID=UPI002E29BFD3|nr:hypothetical protein [Streptomyces sp. NBC_01725]